jgi:hypothetical protein
MLYNMDKLALNGFAYLKMRCAVWGLPQAGILANKLLQKHLLPHGYFKCPNTPSLWKHYMCPILFRLVVDNFKVKYVGKKNVDHLIKCIKMKNELSEDWAGDLYCRIKLNWDYTACTLDISMPGYMKNFCTSINIVSPQNRNVALTPRPPNNMAHRLGHLYLLTSPRNYCRTTLNKSNASPKVSFTMLGSSTSLS